MNIDSGRVEKRLCFSVSVRIWSMESPSYEGRTTTENVSTHGTRILAGRAFQEGELVLLALPPGEFWTRASVVYCHSLPEGDFAVGLRCDAAWDWESYAGASHVRLGA